MAHCTWRNEDYLAFKVNVWDLLPVYLLIVFGVALSVGFGVVAVLIHRSGRHSVLAVPPQTAPVVAYNLPSSSLWNRPNSWQAIRGKSLGAVQKALGISNPKPCSWAAGFSGETPLFIAPPVKGWILVTGSGLPDPGDDVDRFFRFMVGLSRKLGHVQFFSAYPALQHHAWVQAEAGRVLRAFVWAGTTLWKQGKTTPAERQLDLQCPDYGEELQSSLFAMEPVGANTEKVPLLAAQWSLDPAAVDASVFIDRPGVAGEPARLY
jgi:hypothetical protein